MKLLRVLALISFSVLGALSSALAAGSILSGPMLGYRAHREIFLWLEAKDAQQVTLDFWLTGKPETKRSITQPAPTPTPAGGQIFHFRPGLLEPGAEYEYTLSLDGVKQDFPFPTRFKTHPLWEWRTPAPDFSFLFGTCAYFNEPAHDRPGAGYGRTLETFRLMGESGADFMLWGGDNWYYREVDFDSTSGLWYRAQVTRREPALQKLFATMPQYAVWDDHDYGENDANKSYELKDEALRVFQAYWGNPSSGEADNPGIYTKFRWSDATFFLMDNRWHRDGDHLDAAAAAGRKTQYGARQLDWLKQGLLAAQENKNCNFKFIVTGGQVVTDFAGASQSFAYYPEERAELLQFIARHRITGVIFLSGDVHFTELARRKISDTQWVYELTSSPLSSGVSRQNVTEHAADPYRVPGTQVQDQNFCQVRIAGPKEAREVIITSIDKQGAVRFTHKIPLSELQ
ncbi:alkaline phosphatase D family protein [Oleiharenicola lentus]|nr:alkaline phosphatase D family protein [Oleiharenicola lentus]